MSCSGLLCLVVDYCVLQSINVSCSGLMCLVVDYCVL